MGCHFGACALVSFCFLSICYVVTVLVVAPWDYTSEAEVYQVGDAILVDLNPDLYKGLHTTPFNIKSNNLTRQYTLALYRKLPNLILQNRTTSFPLDVFRLSSLEIPFRMNARSRFTITWQVSQTIKFYIMTQQQYDQWKNPDDTQWYDIFFDATPAAPPSPQPLPLFPPPSGLPVPQQADAASHVSRKKVSTKGRSGRSTYTAKETGLYFLVWDCTSCANPSVGNATIEGSYWQYNVTRDPCHDTVSCCTSAPSAPKCHLDWDRSKPAHPVLSLPADPDHKSFVQLNLSFVGRYSFYFAVTFGSVAALFVLVGLAFCYYYRCVHRHHHHHDPYGDYAHLN